jgi:hypothetical protein
VSEEPSADCPADKKMQSLLLTKSTKIVLLLLGIMALVIPAVTKDTISYAQGQGRVAACKANLRQIGIGVQTYEGNHAGKMPPTLKALEPIIKSQTVFVCPASGIITNPAYTEFGYDYRFLNQPKGTDIICWDSRPHQSSHTIFLFLNHANRNVLLADGQVRNLDEVHFQQLHLQGQTWIISRQ